jgi:hypothetical protein
MISLNEAEKVRTFPIGFRVSNLDILLYHGWFHSDGLQVEEAGSIFSVAFLYTRISWYA